MVNMYKSQAKKLITIINIDLLLTADSNKTQIKDKSVSTEAYQYHNQRNSFGLQSTDEILMSFFKIY